MSVKEKILFSKNNNQKKIDLSLCNLNEIPEELFDLRELERVNLSYNNIHVIPEKFLNLKRLESLVLDHNSITNIPSFIGKFSSLKYLSINSNQLSEVAKEVSEMNNIISIDFSSNVLTSIPVEICKMKVLQYLDLSDNKFESIQVDFFKRSFISFGFSHNNFTFKSLKTLIIKLLEISNDDFCISDKKLKKMINSIIIKKADVKEISEKIVKKIDRYNFFEDRINTIKSILYEVTLQGKILS